MYSFGSTAPYVSNIGISQAATFLWQNKVVFQQVIPRSVPEGLDIECRAHGKILGFSHQVQTRDETADLAKQIHVIEFRRSAAVIGI